MTETLSLSAAFMVGLLGGAHCMGMCGGIAGSFGSATKGSSIQKTTNTLLFNLGRILSYGLAGLILGTVGSFFSEISPAIGLVLRILAGVFIILMGFYIADWSRSITMIEKIGQSLWKRLQPLTRPLLPADTASKSFRLGILWGWLPCGLVYSTLALAAATPSSIEAAFVMLAFGFGTLPSMLATGLFASKLNTIIRNQKIRYIAGLLMIAMGIWIIYGNSLHLGHSHHSGMDHSQMDHSQMDHSKMDHSKMDH